MQLRFDLFYFRGATITSHTISETLYHYKISDRDRHEVFEKNTRRARRIYIIIYNFFTSHMTADLEKRGT